MTKSQHTFFQKLCFLKEMPYIFTDQTKVFWRKLSLYSAVL